MDNKELPQEMTYAAVKYTRRFQERGYTEVEMAEDIGKGLAQIAQSHYLKELQAKDTTIKEQAEELERIKGLLRAEVYNNCLYAHISDEDIETDNPDAWHFARSTADKWADDFFEQHNITP